MARTIFAMAKAPKTGTVYTYSADPSTAADPALADLAPNSEVTVKGADGDKVRLGWTDQTGMPREASVNAEVLGGGSFAEKKA